MSNLARAVVAALTERGQTVALAESLTGGLLTSALVDIPGASVVVRGGVVAYASDLKTALLGVDEELLARVGAVSAEVAAAMAEGVRVRLGATYGLSTTGVAGPDPQDGLPAGVVHVALAGTGATRGAALLFEGDRVTVRAGAVTAALELLAGALDPPPAAEQPR